MSEAAIHAIDTFTTVINGDTFCYRLEQSVLSVDIQHKGVGSSISVDLHQPDLTVKHCLMRLPQFGVAVFVGLMAVCVSGYQVNSGLAQGDPIAVHASWIVGSIPLAMCLYYAFRYRKRLPSVTFQTPSSAGVRVICGHQDDRDAFGRFTQTAIDQVKPT